MAKYKKLIAIIASCVIAVAVLVTAIILIVNENKKTTILTYKAGAEIQLMLNANDKVIYTTPLNAYAQTIDLNVKLKGMKANKAVLTIVENCTKLGYIDIDTEGIEAYVHLTGRKSNYNRLKDKITKTTNEYFDKMGIIGRTKVEISDDIKTGIKFLKSTAKDLDDKNNSELMQQYDKIRSAVKEIEMTENNKKKTVEIKASEISAFWAIYDSAELALNTSLAEIEEAKTEYQQQLAETTNTDEIAQIQQKISILEDSKYKAQITRDSLISNATISKQLTNDDIETYKTNYNSRMTSNQAKIDAHLTSFNENKTDIQTKITEYRNAMTNA